MNQRKIAQYQSNQGHLVIVREDGGVALIGRSGRILDSSYIHMRGDLLEQVGACGTNVEKGIELLNGFSNFKWSLD